MYSIYEQLLQKHGVSSYAVSKATGVSQSTLSAWKNGISEPKREKLQLIADYFGVTLDYLVNGEVKEGYYINKETAKIAQEIFDRPDLRALFDASRDAKPEDLKLAADLLKRLKATNPDG